MTEYYRNTHWNKEIEEHFFSKLARARTQKDQYLSIQAGMLVTNNPEQSLKLVDYYFENRKDKFHDNVVYFTQAVANINLGLLEDAVFSYKQVIKREKEFPNSRTYVLTEFPYFVATHKITSEYEFALDCLTNTDKLSIDFPESKFMRHASLALILNDRHEAELALKAAETEKSGIRYHQHVGLVGKEHLTTIKKLKSLSKQSWWNIF